MYVYEWVFCCLFVFILGIITIIKWLISLTKANNQPTQFQEASIHRDESVH